MNALPLKALAPAKLNLCLYVGEKRPDGLHEICSIFQSVTLADELVMEAGGGADEVVCPGVTGPNLAAQALAGFRERFGWDDPPVRVTIEKRIPIAAGLGGGSANAAAVLRLAIAASGIRPERELLLSLATSLGTDVPSQLEPGTQLVTGAGENVEPIDGPGELAIVVLSGNAKLTTGDVYAHADRLGLPERDLEALASALRREPRGAVPCNDLQEAAIDLEPSAGQALDLLRESGARSAIVSGSGPSAFGLYEQRSQAESAKATVGRHWSGDVTVVGAAGQDYGEPRPAPSPT